MLMLLATDHYKFGIGSRASLRPEIISSLLSCPTVEKLVFPAKLPVASKKSIYLSQASDFELSLVPKAFQRKGRFLVPLDGENGITLEIDLNMSNAWDTPRGWSHRFGLYVPFGRAKELAITGSILEQCFREILPLFPCEEQGHVLYFGPSEQDKIYYNYGSRRSILISLEWLSYYGPKALEVLGRERFDNLKTCQKKVELEGGILVVLQEEPPDLRNPAHLARKQQAERELGFDELAKDESRVRRSQPIRAQSSSVENGKIHTD